ncbi:MAG: hypothetical protein WCL06_05230 [Bacteroidota bacterium]
MSDEQKPNVKIIDAENIEVDLNFEITHYHMDENGNYSHELLANWGNKEVVNNSSWEIVKERIKDAKDKVISGELSPIAYYMQKCLTDSKTLSQYVGIAQWRIKRHLKPARFNKLSDQVLQKYADFFAISVAQLKDINSKN